MCETRKDTPDDTGCPGHGSRLITTRFEDFSFIFQRAGREKETERTSNGRVLEREREREREREFERDRDRQRPVSYTHLTLPTSVAVYISVVAVA